MVARGELKHDAIPARLKLRKLDLLGWLKLKLLQYNISSCLYMLDTWERVLFNFFFLVMLLLSVFLFVAYLSTASTTFLSGNSPCAITPRLLSFCAFSRWCDCHFLPRPSRATLLSAAPILICKRFQTNKHPLSIRFTHAVNFNFSNTGCSHFN